MAETKFDNPDIQNHVVDLMAETDMPVSVEFVAQSLSMGWGTARAILLNLAVQGRIKVEKTTKSLIFSLKQKEARKNE